MLFACGDDSTVVDAGLDVSTDVSADTSADVGTDVTLDSETDAGEDVVTTESTYAFVSQVFGAGGTATSYIALSDTLDSSDVVALDDAVEIAGRALGTAYGRALFVGTGDAGTLTRYDLQDDGTLTEGATVSFAGAGVSAIGEYQEQIQVVSETKAYYFDGRTAQMIIWNPSDMTMTSTVSLGDLILEDAITVFATNAHWAGDTLYFPVGWRSSDNARILPTAAMLVIDSTDDSVEIAMDEGRGGYIRTVVDGGDGYLYLATEAYGSAVYRINEDNAPAPCLLRFSVADGAFDETYHVELASILDGANAGTLTPTGTPGDAWIRVFDEEAFSVEVDTNPRVLASTPAWGWARVSLGDEPSATLDSSIAIGTGSAFLIRFGDAPYLVEFASDRSTSSFRPVSTMIPDATLSVTGVVFSAAELR